jgi:hypothetical protein
VARRTRAPEGKQASPWFIVLAVVGVLAGLLVLGFGSRWLATHLAPVVFLWADGDHLRVVAFLLALWASGPLLALAALRVRARWGPWAAAPCWVLVVGLGLLLFGYVPGRHDDGELSRDLGSAVGGPPLGDTGDAFIGSALAAVVCLIVVVPTAGAWVLGGRRTRGRAIACAVGYVAAWVAAGAVVLAVVGDTPARITWLQATADVIRGGDAGVTGDFPVGLDTSVADVVDCDTAADRLRVGGKAPELDGCRRALLVAATGRYDDHGTRTSSGRLVAVVVQVRTEDQLDELDAALDDATIAGGGGLPEPRGDVLVSPARAALSLVVAVEDSGDIPLPSEGAGRRPLTRALAYVVIGSAEGFYLAPPEETPAP